MGKPNVSMADGDVVHVPPSQQTCQGPVPKPGEPLRSKSTEAEPKSEESRMIQPKPEMWLKPPLEVKSPISKK